MKPDDDYSDVINRPTARKPAPREAELHAEDEQNFLSRLLQQLQQQQPAPVGITGAVNGSTASPTPAGTGVNSPSAGTPIRGGIQVQKPVDRRSSSSAVPNQVRCQPTDRYSLIECGLIDRWIPQRLESAALPKAFWPTSSIPC